MNEIVGYIYVLYILDLSPEWVIDNNMLTGYGVDIYSLDFNIIDKVINYINNECI